jgi:hypothetical protein
MSMKNCNDNIGNRTRNFAACSEMPHPTLSPLAAVLFDKEYKLCGFLLCQLRHHLRNFSPLDICTLLVTFFCENAEHKKRIISFFWDYAAPRWMMSDISGLGGSGGIIYIARNFCDVFFFVPGSSVLEFGSITLSSNVGR